MEVFILGAKHTPIGSFQGSLAGHSVVELGSHAISAAVEDKKRRVPMIVIVAAGILALVGFGGSLANVTTQSGWITYRWLDEGKEAVRRIESEHPEALVLSNSDAVAFYAHDPSGFQLAKYRLTNNLGLVSYDLLDYSDIHKANH